MNDHIAKPIRIDNLRAAIARWVAPPATPPSAATEEAQAPPPAPTLDADAGLSAAMGDPQLYRRILAAFESDSRDFAFKVRQALQAADRPTAARLAHDLRSTSGLLGAHGMAHAARQLETACRAQPAIEVPAALIDDVTQRLDVLLREVRTTLRPGA
jgi:HPt (histidine-containing phosphotransfer) domain-containing protein